jgi:transcriptional regulator with XRE-family HTH domain
VASRDGSAGGTTYPNRLRELRNARGFSQAGLGQRVGISQSSIGRLERGEYRIKDYLLEKLAQALDVKPWQVIGVTDSRASEQLQVLFNRVNDDGKREILAFAQGIAARPGGDDDNGANHKPK